MNRNPGGILFIIALFSCHNPVIKSFPIHQGVDSALSSHNDTLKSSVEFYSRKVKENSSDANAWWNLAKLYLKMNKYANAVTYMNKAIKIDSTKQEYYSCLAEACFLSGKVIDS